MKTLKITILLLNTSLATQLAHGAQERDAKSAEITQDAKISKSNLDYASNQIEINESLNGTTRIDGKVRLKEEVTCLLENSDGQMSYFKRNSWVEKDELSFDSLRAELGNLSANIMIYEHSGSFSITLTDNLPEGDMATTRTYIQRFSQRGPQDPLLSVVYRFKRFDGGETAIFCSPQPINYRDSAEIIEDYDETIENFDKFAPKQGKLIY